MRLSWVSATFYLLRLSPPHNIPPWGTTTPFISSITAGAYALVAQTTFLALTGPRGVSTTHPPSSSGLQRQTGAQEYGANRSSSSHNSMTPRVNCAGLRVAADQVVAPTHSTLLSLVPSSADRGVAGCPPAAAYDASDEAECAAKDDERCTSYVGREVHSHEMWCLSMKAAVLALAAG